MDIKIIVDSCCDISNSEKERLGVEIIPLTLNLGDENFIDDDTLDLPGYMVKMKAHQGKVSSACPSPGSFKEAFLRAGNAICITLSENLSGTYGSAVLGKELAEEEGASVEIINSKSACAGEVLLVYKAQELIDAGLERPAVAKGVEAFLGNMKTYFVLDNIENLVKNGRMNKVVGKLISALGVKPIMGADKEGNIALYSHARGKKQTLEKMVSFIKESGKNTQDERLVIAHNNNLEMAEALKELILNSHNFKEILVVQTRGVSSLYANDKGLVMAF